MTRITGQPIVFGSDSVNLGGFVEVINPAAVDRTMRGSDEVVLLKNHDDNYPLARRSARSLLLTKEQSGLGIDAAVDPEITYVSDLLRAIRRRDANGGSFGFVALDDIWTIQHGMAHREVLDMVIRELSVGVTFPAYPMTSVFANSRAQSGPAHNNTKGPKYFDTLLRLAR